MDAVTFVSFGYGRPVVTHLTEEGNCHFSEVCRDRQFREEGIASTCWHAPATLALPADSVSKDLVAGGASVVRTHQQGLDR